MEQVSKYWWLILLKGIILIILSIFVMQYPAGTMLGVVVYIGVSLLLTGIILLVVSISARHVDDQWGWKLAEGLIDIIFAIILMSNPGISASVLPFALGFWMIFLGITTFVVSFSIKKAGDKNWWLNMIGGILTVIVGYILMTDVIAGALAITFWIGFGFMLFGIINVSMAFRVKKLGQG